MTDPAATAPKTYPLTESRLDVSSKRRAPGPAVTRKPSGRAAKPSSKAGSKSGSKAGGSKAGGSGVGRRVRKTLKWLLICGLVGMLVAAGFFVYLYQTTDLPDPNKDFQTQTTHVYYSDGTEIGTFATQNRDSIPLEEMPQTLQDAVVSAEDRTFWTNRGIDPKGILRAAFNNASGGATQGASTITQQYVKILYLTSERSFSRKLKEAILSLKLQREMSKEHILEDYLNTIYFGRGAYGVQAAALAYFKIDAEELNLRQSAMLASVLNNPTGLDPKNGRAAKRELKDRYQYVLDGMASMGTITEQQANRAARRLPHFPEIPISSRLGGEKGHILTLVRKQLNALGYTDQEIDGGGLKITTTLDSGVMDDIKQGVQAQRPEGFSDKQLHIGVAAVEPGTGALKGFYAGQDFLESQINWAVSGGMIGSTMKPVTLAAAIKQGFSLKDTFDGNTPYVFPDGLEVRNEQDTDYGSAISAITALEESVNTAFVDMSASMKNGPEAIYQMAEKLGIPPNEPDDEFPGIPNHTTDLSPEDALITLGRARISPINMANTYATLAAGGERAQVHLIEKVTDETNGHDYTFKSPTKRVLSADISADVTYAMQQVVNAGTGTAALPLGRPVAGKTGTATNSKDQVSSAWFVGATPQLATAVMYVRGDGDDQLDGWLPSYFGGAYPTRTWTAIMTTALAGEPVLDFPEPVYVDGDAPSEGHQAYVPPPTQQSHKPRRSSSAPPHSSSAPPESSSAPPTSSAPPSSSSASSSSAPPSTSAPPTDGDDGGGG
ncbi:MAG: transglycosylase domain-containing protein [Nocardioides sp.]|uniref:transglycosylase domain-containing protein n=1 Tax=Nocardioides sp. TaxID=35761 RepID=UPI0039E63E53